MRKHLVDEKDLHVQFHQKIKLIIKSLCLTLQGPWHFENITEQVDTRIDLNEVRLNFDYLINFQDSNSLIHPDDIGLVKKLIKELKEGKSIDYHFRIVFPDGQIRIVHGFGNLVHEDRKTTITSLEDLDETSDDAELQLKILKYAEQVSHTGSWIWNLQTNELYFSENLYRIFGVEPYSVEPTWDTFSNFIHPDDWATIFEAVTIMKETCQPMDLECRVLLDGGEVHLLKEKSQFFITRSGQKYFIGIIQEITDQKRSESEIKKQKELLQKTLDAVPQMVWVSDAEGRIQFLNDRWFSYTGLSTEQAENCLLNDLDIFHASQIKEIMPHFKACIKLGIPFQSETLVRNSMHQYRWHVEHAQPIFNENGKVVMWVGTFTDVHDLFVSEKKLKENRDLLEAIFDASINGIQVFESVFDDNHEIIDFRWKYHNRQNLKFLKQRDLIGKRMLTDYPGLKTNTLFEKYKQVVKTGIHLDVEEYYVHEGKPTWLHLVAAKLEDGLVVTFQDITKRKQEEIELRESRHFNQLIADSTPDLLYVCDLLNKKIEYVNKQVAEILGQSQERFYALGDYAFEELIHPNDADRRSQHLASLRLAQDDEIKEIEIRIRIANGLWHWFKLRHKIFKRKPDGTVWQIIGLAQDIHERKSAQEKINLQHQMDRQAEKIAQIGNWEWNLQTGVVSWGENLFRLLELEPGSVEPNFDIFIKAIHPDDQHFILKENERIHKAADGPLPLYDLRVLKKDGGIRYLRTAREVISRDGDRLVIGTVRDITQDINMQQELKERIKFIETLIDSSVDRIMAFDRELKIMVWNKACEQLSKISRDKILGKHLLEQFPKMKENKKLLEGIHKTLDGNTVYLPSEDGIYNDGYFDVHFIPIRNEHDQVYSVLSIIRDISERIASQKSLETLNTTLHQKNEELKSLNEELSTFAFIASHDLREPLRKIELFSDTLMQRERDALSESGKDFIRKILLSIQRMHTLIDEILTFSRASASNPKMLEVNLNQILDVVKEDLNDVLVSKKVILESDKLPVFYGNPLQLAQLLQNLITNAVKFQKTDNIPHVRITAHYVSGENINNTLAIRGQMYLKLEVIDNGIGFEEMYSTKIFQMFQRLHSKAEYPGTGMGLAICKKVMANHHGFITVRSQPGEGATFSCYFPVGKQQ